MQGYDYTFDIYSTKWGTTGNKLNDFFKAIFSLNAGETAPINPLQGMPWLDISAGWNNAVLKFYDGSSWVLANEYSPYIKDLKLATGSKSNLWERLEVSINPDGTLKSGLAENMTEWIDSGLIPTYTSDNEFEVPGDQTDIFVENRKVKATLDSESVYSAVESSNYDSFNEVTNVILFDSVINSTISKIENGLIKPGPEGSNPKLNIENVQDVVGTLLSAGSNINLNYDDVNNQLTVSVNGTDLDADTLDGKHLSQVISTAVPVGSVIWRAIDNVPSGFLECNGAELSRTTYSDLFSEIGTIFGSGDGSTTFNLPDLRGEFIRGFDNGRGIDSGRNFGSWQADELRSHTHTYKRYVRTRDCGSSYTSKWEGVTTANTGATGGNETRPRNIALLPCIKY